MQWSFNTLGARLLACGAVTDADDAAAEARLLLETFAGASSALLTLDRARLYESAALDDAVARRQAHEPLAYIVGKRGFWRDEFIVTHDTLIPRPDTETLVEIAVQRLPKNGHFADLCTGTGCVGLSVLRERPDLTVTLIDLYPAALDVARRNAEALSLSDRVTIMQADALDLEALKKAGAPWDGITCNPPYIESNVVPSLSPEVQNEPHTALDGGADGLDFYRRLIGFAAQIVTHGAPLLFEIGYNQGQTVPDIARARGYDCKVIKDYGGNDRVAEIVTK